MVNKSLGVQVAANLLVIYNFLSTVPSRIKFNFMIIRSGENSLYNLFLILFFIFTKTYWS